MNIPALHDAIYHLLNVFSRTLLGGGALILAFVIWRLFVGSVENSDR